MAKVYAMIADGTEEVECLAVLDILRRSGIETVLVAVGETRNVVSSHKVKIEADATVDEIDFSDGDVIFLPGGLPGSENLSSCETLIAALSRANADDTLSLHDALPILCGARSCAGTPWFSERQDSYLFSGI